MKRCSSCGDTKPFDEFHWKYPTRGIRTSKCKVCARTAAAEWRQANRERQAANNRRYYEANRNVLLAEKQNKRKEGPEPFRESDRRYYESHRAKHAETARKWRQANPDRKRALEYRRRARIGDITTDDIEYLGALRSDPCSYCGNPATGVDHIEPLSDGGSPSWGNLTASCNLCNAQKRTLPLLIFLIRASSRRAA